MTSLKTMWRTQVDSFRRARSKQFPSSRGSNLEGQPAGGRNKLLLSAGTRSRPKSGAIFVRSTRFVLLSHHAIPNHCSFLLT
jgi:hypothetical protein